MIKGHGDDIYHYKGIKANFSSNVSAGGTHDSLLSYLKGEMDALEHYPEPCAETLTETLANTHQLKPDQVLVCNGATEAFYLIANQYRGARSLIFTPSFSEYEDACKTASHSITYLSNQLTGSADFLKADLAWICNPNNPDAFCFDEEWLLQQITQYTDCLFIIDEAYIEFVKGANSIINQISKHKNVLVVRSMTKRYAIPALRLGYMLGSSSIISAIQERLMPWRLNTLALKAGEYVLSSEYNDDFDADEILKESQYLQQQLKHIKGVEICDSSASFFLAKSTIQSAELKERLINEYGLLIRDASNFRGLSNYHFRIATQSRENNQQLIVALQEILSECKKK